MDAHQYGETVVDSDDLDPEDLEEGDNPFQGEEEGWRDLIHTKHMVGGAQTIQEVVQILRGTANELARRSQEGWTLEHEVDNGFVFIINEAKRKELHG